MAQLKLLILIIALSIAYDTVSGDLLGFVSFPNNPDDRILINARFDDANKLATINKLYSGKEFIETKLYDFNNRKYAAGLVIDFEYTCQWYKSILVNYFSIIDVMKPTNYDPGMSRVLSIFFSGSWAGENVTRTGNLIQSVYWQMEVLSYDTESTNLYSLLGRCGD